MCILRFYIKDTYRNKIVFLKITIEGEQRELNVQKSLLWLLRIKLNFYMNYFDSVLVAEIHLPAFMSSNFTL